MLDLHEALSELYYHGGWDRQVDEWYHLRQIELASKYLNSQARAHFPEVKAKRREYNKRYYNPTPIPLTPVTCHPERKHRAHGLCHACYIAKRKKDKCSSHMIVSS